MKTPNRFLRGFLTLAVTTGFLAGCGKKNDSIAQAEKTDKDKPSIAIHTYPGRDHAFARHGGEHYNQAEFRVLVQRHQGIAAD